MAFLRVVIGDFLFFFGVFDVLMDFFSMERGELDVMGVEFRLRVVFVGLDSRVLLLIVSELGRLFEREGDLFFMGVRFEILIIGDRCFILFIACLV